MSRQKAHTQENVCSNMKVFSEDESFVKKNKYETERERSNKKVFIWS